VELYFLSAIHEKMQLLFSIRFIYSLRSAADYPQQQKTPVSVVMTIG